MNDVLFDTQKMVERLEGVGVPPAQARVHTEILSEVISALEATIVEHCVSKEDLALAEARINARIDRLELQLRSAIADTRTELMKWVVTVGILQMALITGLVLKLT